MDLIKLIELFKDLPIKKILVLSVIFTFLLSLWKIEVILPYFESKLSTDKVEVKSVKSDGQTKVIDTSDLDISESDLIVIKQYTDRYLEPLQDDLAFSSIYKFIPEGESYMYQGRVLVYLNSKDESTVKLVSKEMNISWIPLFSGKTLVEELLDNIPVTVSFNLAKYQYEWVPSKSKLNNTTPLVIHSVNLDILKEFGVKKLYYFPIAKLDRVVGYMVFYFKREPNEAKLREVSQTLGARLLPYLLGDTK